MNMNRIKTLCAVFAVVLTGVFVAKGDGMEKIPYLAWDEDAQGFVEETCDYAEVITPETERLQPGTWYVVTNDVTRGLIAVSGTAHLIRYSGAPDFTVQVVVEDATVSVVFSDAGKKFNPLEKKDPDVSLSVDERAIGGLGLFMVKRMMDKVTYNYVDGRNVLVVGRKRI